MRIINLDRQIILISLKIKVFKIILNIINRYYWNIKYIWLTLKVWSIKLIDNNMLNANKVLDLLLKWQARCNENKYSMQF